MDRNSAGSNGAFDHAAKTVAEYRSTRRVCTMKTARNILVALQAFLGLGAIFGGGALILSPNGAFLGMPFQF